MRRMGIAEGLLSRPAFFLTYSVGISNWSIRKCNQTTSIGHQFIGLPFPLSLLPHLSQDHNSRVVLFPSQTLSMRMMPQYLERTVPEVLLDLCPGFSWGKKPQHFLLLLKSIVILISLDVFQQLLCKIFHSFRIVLQSSFPAFHIKYIQI